jgi:ABC-type transport system involved in multi-copper enzyme maturation permease subunit
MFAVMTFDRDPMRFQDIPAELLTWVQTAGGWAVFGVFIWLVVFYPRMRAEEQARIPSWQRGIFQASLFISLAGYLASLVLFLVSRAMKNPASIEKYQSLVLTLAGAGGIIAVGVPFLRSLPSLRIRRIGALAKLSFKEAVRKKVLYAFSGLLLIFLFGSWFIPNKPEDQVRNYVTINYWVMTVLLLVAAILLAAFSIPTDIRQQTMHTIITKPVERFEILLGRFFGFTALMTLVLLLMTSLSLIYVLRGIDREAAEESLKAREPLYGELRFENTGDEKKGTNVGREWDYRSYITAANPNQESQFAVWDFRRVPSSLAQRETVRCEFSFDIFRQTKGFENRGVSCEFEFYTANFTPADKDGFNSDRSRWMSKSNILEQKDVEEWVEGYRTRLKAKYDRLSEAEVNALVEKKRARLTANKLGPPADNPSSYRLSNTALDDELAEEYGYYVVPAMYIIDYHTMIIDVPGGLFRNAMMPLAKGASRENPTISTRVSVTKQSATQYVGMAKYDLYWRLDDPSRGGETAAFTLNFFKGAFGLWLRLCLVIGLATALSTYLSGVISTIVASLLYLGGGAMTYIQSIGQGTAAGGGPLEALVRLANRQVALIPLEEGTSKTIAEGGDIGFRWLIRRVLDLIPDVERYNLTEYVGNGFNIPLTQLLLDFGSAALYLLPWIVLGYYLLKWREIAAPT